MLHTFVGRCQHKLGGQTKVEPEATPDVAEWKVTPVWQATRTVTTCNTVLPGLCCASCDLLDGSTLMSVGAVIVLCSTACRS